MMNDETQVENLVPVRSKDVRDLAMAHASPMGILLAHPAYDVFAMEGEGSARLKNAHPMRKAVSRMGIRLAHPAFVAINMEG